jgi:hypothetical protein
MARRYWIVVNGKRLYHDTLGAARRAATKAADRLGKAVQAGYDDEPSRPTRKRKKPPTASQGRVYRMNPLMGGHDFTGEEWKIMARGPYGQLAHVYADNEREARDEVRILRAKGFRVTHMVRLQAPK